MWAKVCYSKSDSIPTPTGDHLTKIQSILDGVQSSYFGEEQYSSLEDKAAFLLYTFAKNHANSNGNKRLALMVGLEFYIKNIGSMFLSDPEYTAVTYKSIAKHENIFELVKRVTESNPDDRVEEMNNLKAYFISIKHKICEVSPIVLNLIPYLLRGTDFGGDLISKSYPKKLITIIKNSQKDDAREQAAYELAVYSLSQSKKSLSDS